VLEEARNNNTNNFNDKINISWMYDYNMT
jgi:hypothetical protein